MTVCLCRVSIFVVRHKGYLLRCLMRLSNMTSKVPRMTLDGDVDVYSWDGGSRASSYTRSRT